MHRELCFAGRYITCAVILASSCAGGPEVAGDCRLLLLIYCHPPVGSMLAVVVVLGNKLQEGFGSTHHRCLGMFNLTPVIPSGLRSHQSQP
ncbi:uncharacterized protein EDB93DRAFT_346863 [Suillus bovinus]|uniref:uncharacterized protein n=1 Tax=Suillus bovinus TaxID=48563 RepID=UPI001B86D4EE|nr:uncharacterized protein EDB93DRAFT_346863 [Suillus bovinus]KAG2150332.1 hypothetical protein EDB93DRAFT_346863 [Suillus bovinus]